MLTLQSANTSRTVPLDSIYYIESSNHKVALHLEKTLLKMRNPVSVIGPLLFQEMEIRFYKVLVLIL